MATREVVVSVCDRCTIEETTPLNRKNKKHSEVVLPQGWLHVAGNTATALVFEMDLCGECKQIVIEAAGKSRQVHSTTSKAKAKRGQSAAKEADVEPDQAAREANAQQESKALVAVS
jgi:hypothetical protein